MIQLYQDHPSGLGDLMIIASTPNVGSEAESWVWSTNQTKKWGVQAPLAHF